MSLTCQNCQPPSPILGCWTSLTCQSCPAGSAADETCCYMSHPGGAQGRSYSAPAHKQWTSSYKQTDRLTVVVKDWVTVVPIPPVSSPHRTTSVKMSVRSQACNKPTKSYWNLFQVNKPTESQKPCLLSQLVASQSKPYCSISVYTTNQPTGNVPSCSTSPSYYTTDCLDMMVSSTQFK